MLKKKMKDKISYRKLESHPCKHGSKGKTKTKIRGWREFVRDKEIKNTLNHTHPHTHTRTKTDAKRLFIPVNYS